jgi:beta-lactamase class A
MHRREFVTIAAASSLATSAANGTSPARSDGGDSEQQSGDLDAALRRFLALPGTPSYLVHAGQAARSAASATCPTRPVHRQRLQDVRAGAVPARRRGGCCPRTSPSQSTTGCAIPAAPCFLDLAGKTAARHVLEAMISHSDNTATTAATVKVGADRVRALIDRAGLRGIRIPDTTRIFSSYIVGAPPGVDWAGRGSCKPSRTARTPAPAAQRRDHAGRHRRATSSPGTNRPCGGCSSLSRRR